MKLTKSKLKQIIKEEILKEVSAEDMGAIGRLGPTGRGVAPGHDRGIEIVSRHVGEILGELREGGLLPDLGQTMADSGATHLETNLSELSRKIYHMIMRETGA